MFSLTNSCIRWEMIECDNIVSLYSDAENVKSLCYRAPRALRLSKDYSLWT